MPFRPVEDLGGFRAVEDLNPRKMGVGEDVARSGLTGLQQGVQGLVGSAGDLVEFGKGLPANAAGFLEDRGIAPKGSRAWFEGAREAEKGGPANKVGGVLAAALAAGVRRAGAPKTADLVGKGRIPTTADVEGYTGAKAQYHKPQTVAGEYARTGGQFAPALISPGTAGQRIAQTVVPAVVSETAGQITKGTKYEPAARIAGALLGAGGAALATRPAPTTRMLAEGSRGATDDQLRMAQALREDAQRRGITLTQAEAVQQVTNNGTGLGRTQRVLEGTPAGSERFSPVMAQRPAQVRQAVGNFADSVAPPAADPYVLGARAQEQAGDVLNGVRQDVNANARPFYDALAQERMPTAAPAYQELIQNPAYQEALGHVRSNPILNQQIAHLPDDSLAVVNEVVKQLDTLGTNARPNPASSTGNAQLAAAYDAARGQADELASAVSEPWRLSRAMVASGREAFLEPLQVGPMGAISRTPQVGAQTRALFPNAPLEGAAPATEQTLAMLPQDTGRGLFRQHVMNTFNEASQNLQSGPNQWAGAKFDAVIAGNPEQRQNLLSGAGAVGVDTTELEGLLEALGATGKRQAQGSLTAYNTEALRNLGEAGAVGETLKTVASGPSMFRRFGDRLQDYQMQRNAAELSEALLANPQRATEILLEARRRLPPGAALEQIERLAITANQSVPNDQRPVPR